MTADLLDDKITRRIKEINSVVFLAGGDRGEVSETWIRQTSLQNLLKVIIPLGIDLRIIFKNTDVSL